ncbi:hypothetical protein CHLNCDRAFT_135058 [Chlorella variabilis]|nr:hypothetical protein CHLNCDRAFT_135058 [Chlorella variabilis]EFN50592.1 hypothetical protein CHLNCDRAFT_135058 [Chlorella variabilis]|eukprot:XP_005842717.1 hypothetical protein CHLNCDRAFT_135058 [Chlorella variabilis]
MLEQCPFYGGYSLTVGTSERGERTPACQLDLGAFRHLLVVFGGPQGLEYLNTCFDQGSRTIRSEEAILISLAFLQPAVTAATAPPQ